MNKVTENEDLSKNRKMKPETKKKITNIFLKNLLIIIVVFAFLGALYYSFYNVELNLLSIILKIISFVLLLFSIFELEQGYKKDNEWIFLVGVEILIYSLITLFMPTFITIEEAKFKIMLEAIAIISAVYYVLKAYISIRKIKKEYKKQISDVRTIVGKEEN